MDQIKSLIKSRECIISTIIVIVDLITKLAANIFLPFEEEMSLIGEKVCFYLTYNQGSTGGQADFMLKNYPNKNLEIVLSCVLALVLLGYILFIRKYKIRTFYKILIGIGLFVSLNTVLNLLQPLFVGVTISSWITSVVGKLTGLIMIYCVIYYLRMDKWVKLSLIIIFAAGIGNLLSHFYSPYRIIDFIYVEGSYELIKIGVFNIADLAFDIGLLGLIASILFYRLKKVLKKYLNCNPNRQ